MAIIVRKAEFSGTRSELQGAVDRYAAALQAHGLTENVPAPWPEYDVLRQLVGSDFVMEDELAEDEPAPENLTNYRARRRLAYIAELGEDRTFATTVGDVLDDLIREVRALSGSPATPEFAALISKIDDIKARFPKL